MTMILPEARPNGGALVGTNLLRLAQFPTGIDQGWIFIDRVGPIAGKPAPTVSASFITFMCTRET
ncbi:hypothetical protein ACW9H0_13425, partial [Pseudomonas monsensis]